ncbi:trypsin-4-like isoform X2 [Tenebrio molitor]|uniref:trypsin-4-like isoform X2 n=1 Tax=Tenebrio molitor TaxID=7067 RepID=UPI0036248F7C
MKSALFVVFFAASASAVPTFIRTETLSPDEKIVWGNEIDIEEVPWQVSLQYLCSGIHICGGSIISTNYVVTAAHCTNGIDRNIMTIRFGTSCHKKGKKVGITSIHQHPDYNPQLIDYDISLLHVASPFRLSKNVAIIGLPSSTTSWPPGTSALSVTVQIISESTCKQKYGQSITSRMLCAGVDGAGKATCQGDSGGPLVIDNVLAGIVSWGIKGCGRKGYPGVFSNVSALRDYIKKVTGI